MGETPEASSEGAGGRSDEPVAQATPRARPRSGMHGGYLDGKKRRDMFLEAIRSGKTIDQAVALIGVQRAAYSRWRERYPEFRMQMDMARQDRPEHGKKWDGGFLSFRKKYFGFDTYFHQAAIVDAIETSPPQGITMVLVPPEHGKTTVVEDYITFKICTEPNIRIAVVSENQKHARKMLNRVKMRLTSHMDLMARFGPFYDKGQERNGKPWSADFFTVCRADHDERDYTLNTVGVTGQIAGSRTDLLIIDDVCSMRNYGQSAEITHVLRQDFFTRPGREGRTIILGTRVGVLDVYERLEEAADDVTGEAVVTKVVKLPAMGPDGEALCPEMWPKEALERKRVIVGEEVWWRNYQQKPKSAALATFTQEMIDEAKNPFITLGQKAEEGVVVLSLDPALGGGNSLTALQYRPNKIRILDQNTTYGMSRVEGIVAQIASFAAMYDPRACVIETMAFQRGLQFDERLMEVAHAYGFLILPHLTGGGGVYKRDEVIGIAQMPKSFIDGTFEIPWGDQATRERMQPLIDELLRWTPNIPTKKLVQDRVMSLWFGWIYCLQQMMYYNAEQSDWKRKALPFRPTKTLVTRGGPR